MDRETRTERVTGLAEVLRVLADRLESDPECNAELDFRRGVAEIIRGEGTDTYCTTGWETWHISIYFPSCDDMRKRIEKGERVIKVSNHVEVPLELWREVRDSMTEVAQVNVKE